MKSLNFAFITLLLAVLILAGCGETEAERQERLKNMASARSLGLAYLEEGRLDDAEIEFRKLIEFDPKEAAGHANLGVVFMRQDNLPAAEKSVQMAWDLAPGTPDIGIVLAEILIQTDREDEAKNVLNQVLETDLKHVESLYKLASLDAFATDQEALTRRRNNLAKIVEIASANLVPRLDYLEALIKSGDKDEALVQLEEIRAQMGELPAEAVTFYDQTRTLLLAGDTQQATRTSRIFHNYIKATPLYQAGVRLLEGVEGATAGTPVLSFSQDLDTELLDEDAILAAVKFTDASRFAVVSYQNPSVDNIPVIKVFDFDLDGQSDLIRAVDGALELRQFDFGRTSEVVGSGILGENIQAISTNDFNNDGLVDILVSTPIETSLFQYNGDSTYTELQNTGLSQAGGSKHLIADLDHDGDLDLLIANESETVFYRNNQDGTFAKMGDFVQLPPAESFALADFDNDGDIDFALAAGSVMLLDNQRLTRFEDISLSAGVTNPVADQAPINAIAAGDYNNDGWIDLIAGNQLFKNQKDGTFTPVNIASLNAIAGMVDIRFFDFDNDGFLDILAAGESKLYLLRNSGIDKFRDVSDLLLPADLPPAVQIEIADYNEDRDLDIFFAGTDGQIYLLRNDGGNVNKSFTIQPRGLLSGNGKNNYFGVGARLEVRAGNLFQVRTITEPVSHIGLGNRLKADVVRIIWTNGVPQNIFLPGSDQDLIEEQVLKGSCPFIYTWDGEKYTFATDILWRSALGMPLGIMSTAGDQKYAPSGSARDFVRIPPELLVEDGGEYRIQMTGELWETPYIDQVKLIAFDHPKGTELFINERFGPPPAGILPTYLVSEKISPVSAIDERGNDVLPALLAADQNFVSTMLPGRFQGNMKMHDLILDPGQINLKNPLHLYLKGWIFPGDASINVAMSQSDKFNAQWPVVQVKNGAGIWQTIDTNMGFPMGKNKMVIVDLTDKYLSDDHRIRIQTNMELYWDQAFFVNENADIQMANIDRYNLDPTEADLHYRGFSKLYRTSPYGPHLYDYSHVSTETKWRDLEGNYTKFGNVLPLLSESDSRTVIMNAGDEISFTFDAENLPELAENQTRTFILFTDGWLKDGDLNTATGKTVLPMPFHGMSEYPYSQAEIYPFDDYIQEWNTRKVTQEAFRSAGGQ